MDKYIFFKTIGSDGEQEKKWNLEKTVAIVLNIWDKHWCAGVNERILDLAPRVNEFLSYLRNKGLKKVVHCPLGVSDSYKKSYARQMTIYFNNTPIEIPSFEIPDLNKIIDPYGVACDCFPKCQYQKPQEYQNNSIEILGATEDVTLSYDLICDEFMHGNQEKEEWYFFHALKELDIENIFIMGAYLNTSLIYSKLGIKNLVALKYNVVVMEDLVDGMYPQEEMPYKTHFDIQDDVINYIRRNLCQTTTTMDIVGVKKEKPYFSTDNRFFSILKSDVKSSIISFDQSEERKQSMRQLPVGVKASISQAGYLKELAFVYDFNAENAFPFYPGAKIDFCRVYLRDNKIVGIQIISTSYMNTRTRLVVIGQIDNFDEKKDIEIPYNLTPVEFYGFLDSCGEISSLGIRYAQMTYFGIMNCKENIQFVSNTFIYKNEKGKTCLAESIDGSFGIYSMDEKNWKKKKELGYTTWGGGKWRALRDGLIFHHYMDDKITANHQSGIIHVCDSKNVPYEIAICDQNGVYYLSDKERCTDYKEGELVPYYKQYAERNHQGKERTSKTEVEKSAYISFDESVSSLEVHRVSGIVLWSGYVVDAVKMIYDAQEEKAKKYGGEGGGAHSIILDQDEWLIKIKGRTAKYAYGNQRVVSHIEFYTNKGRRLCGGTERCCSEFEEFEYLAQEEEQIYALRGAYKSYIANISVGLYKLNRVK